jgi:alkanesulfonate monooxygenase SsuD/methylene tetrahydromethanopterin reductase-like flavin-dependent oxidoreductase (luciferase family)
MAAIACGIALWSQGSSWPAMLAAGQRIDALGYDHLWTWDHLYAIYGSPDQPIFEGWSVVAALAAATRRARIGLLVGANTTRNPGLVAKSATTLDHISNGRAILGLGGGWNPVEHVAHGIDFGASVGQRLDWLDESAAVIRSLLDGGTVTSQPGDHYAFNELRHRPAPVQGRLPIMIGGGGEKKTLRTVARDADLWNVDGTPEQLAHKVEVLRGHCEAVGRDIARIEFGLSITLTIRDRAAAARQVAGEALAHNGTPWSKVEDSPSFLYGSPAEIADRLGPYVELGFRTLIAEQPAPYDVETLERFIGEVGPQLVGGSQ